MKYNWSDLEKLYIDDKLSMKEIGKLKSCNDGLVYYNLKKQGIKTRSKSEATRLALTTNRLQRKGKRYSNWKGERYKSVDGYIITRLKPDSPFFAMADKYGCILEHRLIMARHLGRCLNSSEIIHHTDGNRDNNDIKNLRLLTRREHRETTAELVLQICHLSKEIRLLRWQINEMQKQLQPKLRIEEKDALLF